MLTGVYTNYASPRFARTGSDLLWRFFANYDLRWPFLLSPSLSVGSFLKGSRFCNHMMHRR
jgi:hypothetical protein